MDEVIPNNSTDFLESSLISTSNVDTDFAGLTSITDPLKSDGHVLRAQAREGGLGVNAPYLLVYLSQGQSFDIAVLNVTQGQLSSTTFEIFEYILTTAEADSITDYTDLEIRMEASCNSGTCNAGASRDTVQVSWVEFAILDEPIIPPPVLDTVSVVNSTALQINFTAPVDETLVVSYDIRKFNGTGFSTIGNIVKGNTLSFTEGGLIADTFYRYHIVSIGSAVESVPSNEIGQRTTLILFSARPDSSGLRWVNGLGNPPCSDIDTHFCVDEDVRNDGDFIQTTGLGTSNSDVMEFTLSDIEDPLRSDSHFLKYTLRRADIGTNPVEFEIVLRQGVTTIATFTHTSLPTTYVLFAQELTGTQTDAITDYSDLELTLTADCDAGCSNQEREKVNVSWVVFEIEQVTAPSITTIDTLSSSSLRLNWTGDDLDSEITDIIIQRNNGTDFVNAGNVSIAVFSFDDTGLPEQKIFKYRLKGMIPNGFSKAGLEFEGATPPSEATLDTQGAIIEPSANNAFTFLQRQEFVQTVELYNLNNATIQLIFDDIETNQLNAYESILKMINATYDSSQELKNVGAFYGTKYLEISDVDQFLTIITDSIRNATGATTEGDNHRAGYNDAPT